MNFINSLSNIMHNSKRFTIIVMVFLWMAIFSIDSIHAQEVCISWPFDGQSCNSDADCEEYTCSETGIECVFEEDCTGDVAWACGITAGVCTIPSDCSWAGWYCIDSNTWQVPESDAYPTHPWGSNFVWGCSIDSSWWQCSPATCSWNSSMNCKWSGWSWGNSEYWHQYSNWAWWNDNRCEKSNQYECLLENLTFHSDSVQAVFNAQMQADNWGPVYIDTSVCLNHEDCSEYSWRSNCFIQAAATLDPYRTPNASDTAKFCSELDNNWDIQNCDDATPCDNWVCNWVFSNQWNLIASWWKEFDRWTCGLDSQFNCLNTFDGCVGATDDSCTWNGGSCEIPLEDWSCVSYPSTYITQPASDTANGCVWGTYSNESNTVSNRQWNCDWISWWSSVLCSAQKEYCWNTSYDPWQNEECDESTGTANCTSCTCDAWYSPNWSGQCESDIACSNVAPGLNASVCNDWGIPDLPDQSNTLENSCSPTVACDWTCDLWWVLNWATGQCEPYELWCNDTVTDSWGSASNYGNDEDRTVLICPDVAGEVVSVDFSVSEFEGSTWCSADSLTIHNGDSLSDPVLAVHCNTSNVEHFSTSSDSSWCLLFHFVSDASVNDLGWEAQVLCWEPLSDAECVDYPNTYSTQLASDDATWCVEWTYVDSWNSSTHWQWECNAPTWYESAHCQAAKPYCWDWVCTVADWETCTSCNSDCWACVAWECKGYPWIYSIEPGTDDSSWCDSWVFENEEDTLLYWKRWCKSWDWITTDSCVARKGLGTCGNGWDPELGEQCDDGNFDPYDGCTNNCALARCGDWIVQTWVEECDRNAWCDTSCQRIDPVCTLEADTISVLLWSEVTFDLTYPTNVTWPLIYECSTTWFCGDGYIDWDGADNILWNWDDELCDDGDTDSNDGCSSTCQFDIPDLIEYENICTNWVQDPWETAIDCWGWCASCESCFDWIQNQDETWVDCWGIDCGACPSCFDWYKNGDEVWVDCWWSCSSC